MEKFELSKAQENNNLLAKIQVYLRVIDSSKIFQGIIIAVILLSALLIGVRTHNIPERAVFSCFDGFSSHDIFCF
jgi:hypothetical protein